MEPMPVGNTLLATCRIIRGAWMSPYPCGNAIATSIVQVFALGFLRFLDANPVGTAFQLLRDLFSQLQDPRNLCKAGRKFAGKVLVI